ncbi:uncharacterized protein si:ch211-165g14.1 [Thalassophryne amazonica]|uniref:uncharacterized protein si:ch211-165g14.1 n=1 Tax=Thalassophryne amazonica TaxID=390379 RepID=UPI001471586C|nr:uncharacterized protein si:ch211-165g14.1 [Thalassophryne amazonica]XP_034046077.1 uncharacterized protein si:ch211-165g14.1 [Thalassophryne amazonica]XP_034046078.1 uncharacterized protein si:ch211-165g14.1 [Thalassophryne amazonica]
MEVSSQDPPFTTMDLSKSYSVNPLTCSHTQAKDLAKKPEWYHRRLPSCSSDLACPYRSGSRATSSYNSLSTSLHPETSRSVHCGDMEQSPESLSDYMNSALAQGLELYHDGVHGSLWHPGFYGPKQPGSPVPESSGGEESDSGSDVIFLVSSGKEPLLCSPFIQDSVRHIVEPLSPAVSSLEEGQGYLPQPLSSASPDSSYSEDSSDSSVDIPVHHTRPIVLQSDLSAVYGNPVESPVDVSSDDSDVIEVTASDEKKKDRSFPCKKNLLRKSPQSDNEKSPPREVRYSTRNRNPVPEWSQYTCSPSRSSLRRRAKNVTVGIYNENFDSDDLLDYLFRVSSSDTESVVQRKPSQRRSSQSGESAVDLRTDGNCPSTSPQRESIGEQPLSDPLYKKTVDCKRKKAITVSKVKKLRRSAKQRVASSTIANGSANKKRIKRRKRKRRSQTGPSALFSPREPEIKLKYATVKEEKKDKKLANFYPFVHMEQSLCTVVNYQEDEAEVRSSTGFTPTAHKSTAGFVPSTSCFQLGRLSSESRCRSTLACCLCGQTANVMGLGDLHGPYFPSGLSVDSQRRQQDCSSQEEEEANLNGLGNSYSVNSSDDCDYDGGSAVKGLHGFDNHRLPKVPLRLSECWIHEDCGIWSAGVFLVRGKLYGLREAAQLARETSCSSCQQTGAITGCFQKGCSRNYHYRCALQSGCVLNEENFSLRCPEHKNKPFTCVMRQDKR